MNNSIPNMATDVVNQYKNHFKGKKKQEKYKFTKEDMDSPLVETPHSHIVILMKNKNKI